MDIHSQIDGEFTGTEDEVVYKLTNGQVWQQIGYSYSYTYSYMPRVTIRSEGGRYVMDVQGFNRPIPVRRLG